MMFNNHLPWQSNRSRYSIWVFSWIVPLVVLFICLARLSPTPSFAQADDKIAPDLQTVLLASEANERLRFIVHFQESAVFSPSALPTDKVERRTLIVQQLQETAASNQASLLPDLDQWQADGRITDYRPLWIINAIAIEGSANLIPQIAARPEVKQIALDSLIELIPPMAESEHAAFFQFSPANPPSQTFSWGLDRIQAPHVWHGLGIDGSGVTVAIMDSGVDWLHTDLFPNYRGNLGNGNIQHAGNWYQAAVPAVTVPEDWVGHGTHVAGTAVGQNGIGVAPGAQWIAVAISDQSGRILESYVHVGFEWLVAPNGDPNLAPDIVNGSWGGPGANNVFVEDIATLKAAGIMTIFSAGNSGPGEGSIQRPASYTDTLAVGASDERDELTWFSSRGPSPFTDEPHPHIIAPGTNILSAFPNNTYAYAHGTSMSAPHVSGATALLLSANPSLTAEQVKQILLTTAVPVDTVHPNNNSGWGRLDAYTAVSQVTASGTLKGTIQDQGVPLPGIPFTLTTPSGAHLPFVTDENGQYNAPLLPGTYAIALNTFGYFAYSANNLIISNINHTLVHNINLTALPSATVTGFVRTSEDHTPISATIQAEGTPVVAHTDSNGHYSLSLPAGQYDLVVKAISRRLGHSSLTLVAGQTYNSSFYLTSGPAILLVDSGQWYYRSTANYYQESLDALEYSYRLWEIRNPYTGAPAFTDLEPYDTVIWNAPEDSPGVVAAGATITQFLKTGGNFLVSGQNVARYDGFGFGTQSWWYHNLEGRYLGPITPNGTNLNGLAGTDFEGLTFTLNGADSAQNQVENDTSQALAQSLTQPIFHYSDGRIAGLQRSHCQPFHMVYLGFGLEGVTGAANRQAILEDSFDYFKAPLVETGVRWITADIEDFALLSTQLVYTITMQNLSETVTDTFDFQIENAQWATSLFTTTASVGPCQSAQTVLTLDVPENLPPGTVHTMAVTAVSHNTPALSTQFHLRHQIPHQILFIDDDRWYDRQGSMLNALDEMGITYDTWETGWAFEAGRGSPPAALLQAYDIIIWYTGYDWFQPITNQENAALHAYLAQGGRLFLTSQDYLYYHSTQPLVQDYFGLLAHQEAITPTQVYAAHTPVLPNELAGPVPLKYRPYLNFSDGLIPTQADRAVLWGDQGMAAGLINAGLTEENRDWRLIFWSVPFETMTATAYLPAMNGIMGWLGDLGDSTFVVNERVVAAGSPQTYTLTLKNLPSAPTNEVQVTNSLPAGLTIVPGTIVGNATYNAATSQLSWQGNLAPGASHIIQYQAIPSGGPRLDNRVTIHYERHKIAFNQTATVWVETADLSGSQLTAVTNSPALHPLITYTLRLQNDGFMPTNSISAVVRLPDAFYPLTDTLHVDAGTGLLANQRIHWRGDLLPGQAITITMQLTGTTAARIKWHSATAVVQDGYTDTQVFYYVLPIRPFTYYWPFVAK